MLHDIVLRLKSMTCKEMQEMADAIGVHFNTLNLIRLGKNSNPKYSTIESMLAYFEQKKAD